MVFCPKLKKYINAAMKNIWDTFDALFRDNGSSSQEVLSNPKSKCLEFYFYFIP